MITGKCLGSAFSQILFRFASENFRYPETLSEIITDHGMTTEQYQEKVQSASQSRWQEMGLSEDEIKTRTQEQLERQADCDGAGLNHSQGGARYGQNNR